MGNISIIALKANEDIIEPLADRIEGRTSLHNIYHPITDELIIAAGEEISSDTGQLPFTYSNKFKLG